MNPQSVESLMAEIEIEDPINLADLTMGEQDVRRLMANHFCEIDSRLSEHGMSADARLEVMAAIAAHTMVANMVLHFEQLRRLADQNDFRAWMTRHGIGH